MDFILVPIASRELRFFLLRHDRHRSIRRRRVFGLAVALENRVVGVAAVNLPIDPVSRDGFTAEITRFCVLGDSIAGKDLLYSAARKTARAMGYHRLLVAGDATDPPSSESQKA